MYFENKKNILSIIKTQKDSIHKILRWIFMKNQCVKIKDTLQKNQRIYNLFCYFLQKYVNYENHINIFDISHIVI